MTTLKWFASFVLAATIGPRFPQKHIARGTWQVYPSASSTVTK